MKYCVDFLKVQKRGFLLKTLSLEYAAANEQMTPPRRLEEHVTDLFERICE